MKVFIIIWLVGVAVNLWIFLEMWGGITIDPNERLTKKQLLAVFFGFAVVFSWATWLQVAVYAFVKRRAIKRLKRSNETANKL